MAREKKPIHKVQMTEGKRNIIRQLLEECDIESVGDIQSSPKARRAGGFLFRQNYPVAFMTMTQK